mmetsp:Transcript_87208/g.241859  ORF Transcript_87208/g.241859 Transcript_87208/m.241859 type:complete len:388 (+) Transcript_87208:90-1253(+)
MAFACGRRRGVRKEPSVKFGPADFVESPEVPHQKSEPDAEPAVDTDKMQDKLHHLEHQPFIRRLRSMSRDLSSFDFWVTEEIDPRSPIGYAVRQLKVYYEDWRAAWQDPFWHRKSHQVVLAVVVCRCADGALVAHRGMNTEVSLPSGSLCAERAGIATAASQFHAAHTIEAVAVLDPNNKINPLWPCEVCQSWLAKLRDQSSAISIIAVSSSDCETFAVRVNGKQRPPPRPDTDPPQGLVERIVLAQGTRELPWEAQELVYVSCAWDDLKAEQRQVLKVARSRGTHLLVGLHSDEVLSDNLQRPLCKDHDARFDELMDNRYVSSVLQDAPWCLSQEMVTGLGIRHVVAGPGARAAPHSPGAGGASPQELAKSLGILEEVMPPAHRSP